MFLKKIKQRNDKHNRHRDSDESKRAESLARRVPGGVAVLHDQRQLRRVVDRLRDVRARLLVQERTRSFQVRERVDFGSPKESGCGHG